MPGSQPRQEFPPVLCRRWRGAIRHFHFCRETRGRLWAASRPPARLGNLRVDVRVTRPAEFKQRPAQNQCQLFQLLVKICSYKETPRTKSMEPDFARRELAKFPRVSRSRDTYQIVSAHFRDPDRRAHGAQPDGQCPWEHFPRTRARPLRLDNTALPTLNWTILAARS